MHTILLKNKLTAWLVAAVVCTACSREKLFDDALDGVPTSTAFSSAERIEKSAVGMYSALQNINWGCGRNLIYCDVQGLDANPNNFFGNIGFYNLMRSNDGTVTAAWSAAYNTIFTSNFFVRNLIKAEKLLSLINLNQYLGKPELFGQYNYFYSWNFWGLT